MALVDLSTKEKIVDLLVSSSHRAELEDEVREFVRVSLKIIKDLQAELGKDKCGQVEFQKWGESFYYKNCFGEKGLTREVFEYKNNEIQFVENYQYYGSGSDLKLCLEISNGRLKSTFCVSEADSTEDQLRSVDRLLVDFVIPNADFSSFVIFNYHTDDKKRYFEGIAFTDYYIKTQRTFARFALGFTGVYTDTGYHQEISGEVRYQLSYNFNEYYTDWRPLESCLVASSAFISAFLEVTDDRGRQGCSTRFLVELIQ